MRVGGSLPEQTPLNEKGHWEQSNPKEQYSPQRSPRLLKGLGGYTYGGRSATPHGNSTIRRTPLRGQMLEQGLGGYSQLMSISRVSVHRSRHPTRRPSPSLVVCTGQDDHGPEHRKSVLRIDQGSSAGYRRIQKEARANRKASSARTPLAASRAQEPGHLLRVPCSHLTHQSREA